MRMTCSTNEYLSLSQEEKSTLINDFLLLIKTKYATTKFGYDSFPELNYDEMVLSTLFDALKVNGLISSDGPMVFKLTQ